MNTSHLRQRRHSTQLNGDAKAGPRKSNASSSPLTVFALLLDWPLIFSLVYGGCCVNAFSLEQLLNRSSSIGTALTFSQMLFIALQGLPSFMTTSKSFPGVRLRPRLVPLQQWALQVLTLWTMSLLNNWAFAYDIPLTVQIVFRSGGLVVSCLFGYLFLSRRYNLIQLTSILCVSYGVVLTSLSRPTSPKLASDAKTSMSSYIIGIAILTISLFLTGYLGLLQEKTKITYGPCWQEGLFYTHFLAIPLFLPFTASIRTGLSFMAASNPAVHSSTFGHLLSYQTLFLNLFSQLACVAGVNMLTSRLSSVSTNLILTSRKALSLCISVWWFGSPWNEQMTMGSLLVGAGTVGYAVGGFSRAGKMKIA